MGEGDWSMTGGPGCATRELLLTETDGRPSSSRQAEPSEEIRPLLLPCHDWPLPPTAPRHASPRL